MFVFVKASFDILFLGDARIYFGDKHIISVVLGEEKSFFRSFEDLLLKFGCKKAAKYNLLERKLSSKCAVNVLMT